MMEICLMLGNVFRLALERLYTIVYAKHGPPSFNPNSWQDQTAEYMWDGGAGKIIEAKIPGAGKELKDILVMTAAGSHDKAPRGETDLRNSIKFLKKSTRYFRCWWIVTCLLFILIPIRVGKFCFLHYYIRDYFIQS